MYKSILLAIILASFSATSQGQIAAPTPFTLNMGGGSAAITPDFIVDWSIGESTIIETYYGENTASNSIVSMKWFVTSGILQPFDTTHIIYNPFIPRFTNQEIRFYPVPTPNIINIDFRSQISGKVTMQLYSREGRLLGIKEFTTVDGNSTQQWDLTNKAAGLYYFRILLSDANGNILKQGTFNIEKL